MGNKITLLAVFIPLMVYHIHWCKQSKEHVPTSIVQAINYGFTIKTVTECKTREFHRKENAVKFMQKLNKRKNVTQVKIDSL